jgi:hypothetical protein
MELEPIFWGRLRVLQTRAASLEGRVATLEGHAHQLAQRSDERWRQVRWLADLTVPIGHIISGLARHWGLLILALTTVWAFVLPALRWLWQALTASIGYLSGLLGG